MSGPPPAEGARERFLSERYFPAFDGLRCLAICGVLWHHCLPWPWPKTWGEAWPGWLGRGHAGVPLFFALSGFLITTLLLAEHRSTGDIALGSFWARRTLRIFPLLLTPCWRGSSFTSPCCPRATRTAIFREPTVPRHVHQQLVRRLRRHTRGLVWLRVVARRRRAVLPRVATALAPLPARGTLGRRRHPRLQRRARPARRVQPAVRLRYDRPLRAHAHQHR